MNLIVPDHLLFIDHLKLRGDQIRHLLVRVLVQGIFLSDLSHEFMMPMLVEFDLILIGLHLIQQLLSGVRGIYYRIDVTLIVTDQSIVVLTKLF